jgi:hypothetical protein
MLPGYLDESGIQDGAPVCIVAGYFGGPRTLEEGNEAPDSILQSILQGLLTESDCPFFDDVGLNELLKGIQLPPD